MRAFLQNIGVVLLLAAWMPAVHASLKNPPTLIVGSELDFPPFALSKEGAGDGFTVDLWQAVAKEAGLKSDVRVAPFHKILRDFKSGKVDVLINLAESAERRQYADFSVPHVTMRGAIFVREGDNRISAESDLHDKSLIVLRADLAHDYARARGWGPLVPVRTAAEGFNLLASGKHDAMLIGKLVGLHTLNESGIKGVKATDTPVGFSQRFAFAVRKGNANLLAQINDGLASVRASGRYEDIYEKWFGALDPPPLDLGRYRWYFGAGAGVLALLILGYARERRLRYQLNHSISLLNAAFESTADGILVVDREGKTTYFNHQFLKMWNLPENLAAGRDDAKMLQFAVDQLADPDVFLEKVRTLDAQPEVESFDELKLKDGRIFERYSQPQWLQGAIPGRVWSFRDITERKQAEEQIRASLQEKEVMLKEIHHRVKNNLQIISSLLYLQSLAMKDDLTKQVFRESQSRVRSMALVHERMYRSNSLNAIDFGEQLRELAGNVASGYGDVRRRVRLEMELASMPLELDLAISVSLIFNELLSNVYKHGFPGDRRGTVQVKLARSGEKGWVLRVADDGVGLPAGFDWEASPTVGLKIVRSLVEQIHGEIKVQSNGGVAFELRRVAPKASPGTQSRNP